MPTTLAATAFQRVLDALDRHGSKIINRRDSQASAQCPAHEDHTPSLSVRSTETRVLLCCHAGCQTEDVVAALGLQLRDLYEDTDHTAYSYLDRVVFRYYQPKTFRQNVRNGAKPTLYRLLRVVEAVAAGETVWLTEGEEDCHSLELLGVTATSAPMGATNFDKVDPTPLQGATVVAVVDQDEAGQKWVGLVKVTLDGVVSSLTFVKPRAGKDASDHVAAGFGVDDFDPLEPAVGAQVTALSDVQPEELTWLWAGRLPAGKLVVLDGDPSLGKSTLTLDWSARVSTGSPWPDGAVCELGDTVLLSAEDGISDTIRPRLDAAGGDPTRVHALTGITYRDGDVLRLRPPTLPADLPELRAAIQRTRARLVVIDVLMAFLGDTVNSHRDQDVRRVLAALAAIADETGATIVLLRHLNKTTGGSALYRGGGSIGIIGAARAGFVVAADPDDDSGRRRILAVTKMNLAEEPPSISYTLEGTDSGVARVVWGEVSQHRANTLLAQHDHEDGEDTTEQGFAVDWLVDFLDLNQGRAARTDVVKEAKDAGITLATLNRARVKAGVQFISEGFPRKTYWTRPVTISSQSSQSSHLLRVETTEMTETTDSQQPAQSSQSSQLSQPIKGETTEMTETTEACPNCGRPLAGPAHPHCQTSDRHEA